MGGAYTLWIFIRLWLVGQVDMATSANRFYTETVLEFAYGFEQPVFFLILTIIPQGELAYRSAQAAGTHAYQPDSPAGFPDFIE